MVRPFWRKPPEPVPEVTVPIPRPTRRFGMPLFYCGANANEQCLLPRPLTEMRFGCNLCKNPPLYKDLPDFLKAQLPPVENLHELWARPRPICPEHRLALFPRCPYCPCAIASKNFGAPIPLLAGSLAGKTVYSAALAIALNQQNRLGGLGARVVPNGEYRTEILGRLVKGTIPPKTQKGERQRRVRIHLGGSAPWPPRLVTISDSAGEIFEKSELEEDEVDVGIKSLLLFSDASIYLLNPELSGQRDGRRLAPVDVFGVLSQLLQLLVPTRVLEALPAATVNEVLRLVEVELHKRGYPGSVTDGNHEPLASLILTRIQHQCGPIAQADKVRKDIAGMLKTISEHAEKQPSYTELLQEMHRYIADRTERPFGDERVNHRLALVISKFDLLESSLKSTHGLDFTGLDDILPKLPPDATPADWKQAITRYSNRCEKLLRDIGEGGFMNWAHGAFRDVGVFFVSSLGRKVECFVEETNEGPNQAPPPTAMWNPLGPGLPSPAPAPQVIQSRWRLNKRLVEGTDGTREPTPKGVELPLMWLMLGDA